jgi:hypothetical protein
VLLHDEFVRGHPYSVANIVECAASHNDPNQRHNGRATASLYEQCCRRGGHGLVTPLGRPDVLPAITSDPALHVFAGRPEHSRRLDPDGMHTLLPRSV